MKIAVLHPSAEQSTCPFKDFDPQRDPARHLPEHTYEQFYIAKATVVRQLIQMAQGEFDVAINLCDGAWDEDRPGIEVIHALERLEIAFTGSDADFYEPSREAMKMVCQSAGLQFPAYVFARRSDDVERALDILRFPMIVKHPNSYSSIGMSRSSRVSDAAGLRRQTEEMIAAYGAALIEEFIEGREFTVMVTEPRVQGAAPLVLQPVEFLFPPGETFKHFDLKWVNHEQMRARCVDDANLDERLRFASAQLFTGLNGCGFGRCDIRVDAAGQLFVLEINPNCGVFYPEGQYGCADFILANDPLGHRGFPEHLLGCAVRRRNRKRRCWEVRFDRELGFGLYATRSIKAGELILPGEEQPHCLVSRRQVEQRWHELKQSWFSEYCWPLTRDTYVKWSDHPEDWRPINHSCDPNTWLDGLDLVARRNIAADEALTLEYATFCGTTMKSIQPCRCGTSACRGVIHGTDHLLPEIRERCADHVSDYIRAAWRRAGVPARSSAVST